jgi:hypothetical protein
MAKKKINNRQNFKFMTDAIAPIAVEILLFFFFKKQKIGTDSGISSKKNYFCQADRLIACFIARGKSGHQREA